MKKESKTTHGGKRPGSGQPKKEPTKTLSYRVPEKYSKRIDTHFREILNKVFSK